MNDYTMDLSAVANQSRKRSNHKQRAWMLQKLHANQMMAREHQENADVKVFWEALAIDLNKMGCHRTAQKWQDIWNNWVVKTRGKARKVITAKTEGGPEAELTAEDTRVLEIAGSASVEGFSDLEEGLLCVSVSSSPPLPSPVAPPRPHAPPPPVPTRSRSPLTQPGAAGRRRRPRHARPSSNQFLIDTLAENGRLMSESIVKAAEIIAAAITNALRPEDDTDFSDDDAYESANS